MSRQCQCLTDIETERMKNHCRHVTYPVLTSDDRTEERKKREGKKETNKKDQ